MRRYGIVMAAAVAASLSGTAGFAQDSPADTQAEMPQDVPPQFTHPENAPPQAAPAPPEPAQAAQPDTPAPNGLSDAVNAMIGAWEFSNADHDKICRFNFRSDSATGGYKLDVDKNCPNLFPSTGTMVAWSLDSYGNLRLLDGQGKDLVDLSEVEGGMFDGFTPEEGRYILQTAAAAPMRSAADMIGNWAITRGSGKPICELTLANSPAGDALALIVKPGCDPFVTRFAPSAWRMDQGSLVLLSARGLNWQFEENDPKTWQRVPETADPILLIRQ